MSKNYYPQMFYNNVNTLLKKNRWLDRYIADDLEISFDDSDKEHSYEKDQKLF